MNNILLVEDNPDEILITQEAFRENKIVDQLHIVKDGYEVMKYLRNQEPYLNSLKPDLILLDLNLPKKSGKEILVEIKNDDNLKEIPVVILSTSSSNQDIKFSYQNHANGYITKPLDFFQFVKIIEKINEYWFNVSTLPGMKK